MVRIKLIENNLLLNDDINMNKNHLINGTRASIYKNA